MTTRFYSSVAQQTTLSGSINASTTTVIVASATGFPASTPYTLAIDYGSSSNELVDVNSAAGTTLTVTRAVDGTSGQSHSSGAVVRHVSSGRDFSDSRTHENTSSSVHGVSGSVVGTTSTQSLSNKTLTSPELSGTVTGSPTFSGALVFSGGVTLSSTLTSSAGTLSGSFAGTPTFSGAAVFTGGPSFTTSPPLFQRAVSTNLAFRTNVSGDAANRFEVMADGKHQWGDGTAALDTNLYRSATDTLKTDDNFLVGADFLGAANVNTGAMVSYAPTWASTGGVTSISNGTLEGYHVKIGRLVKFWIILTWGSSSISTGTEWSFTLPFAVGTTPTSPNVSEPVNAWAFDTSASTRYMAFGYVNQTNQRVEQFTAHATATAWDQADPFTYASGDRLNIWGSYVATS